MKKVLFVDGCFRKELSRTARLSRAFFSALEGYDIVRIDLDTLPIVPLGRKEMEERNALTAAGEYGHTMFALAKQFAEADMVVIAAPFWDMGIPAKLKTYLEHVSVSGIAFDGATCQGACRAERMVFLTTRGLEIEEGNEQEQATPYLKALCRFFGIEEFMSVSCYGLDVVPPEECESRLRRAEEEAIMLAKSLEAYQ